MPVKAKYVHTNLTARDWLALVRFYCDVFGCIPKLPERDLSGPWLDELTALSSAHLRGVLPGFSEGGPTLEVFSYGQMVPGAKPVVNEPGFGHIAFLVDDVEKALRAVLAAGGGTIGKTVETKVAGVGVLKVVYTTDPEGNIVELQHWS
jgi:predicted enzyme related to lactoylglutathione lyase